MRAGKYIACQINSYDPNLKPFEDVDDLYEVIHDLFTHISFLNDEITDWAEQTRYWENVAIENGFGDTV